jgi:hypothetical protein
MTTLDYSNRRTPLAWIAWPTLLSVPFLIHYTLSAGLWTMWIVGCLRNPSMRDEVIPSLHPSASAYLLWCSSAALFVAALKGWRGAWRGVLILLLSTVAFFVTDVCFDRYQISICIATKEYWDNGGVANYYFTWWWFNDRWLGW